MPYDPKIRVFVLLLVCLVWSCSSRKTARILVFSKTAGFHHESIPAGIAAIIKLGDRHHFMVDTTTDASQFNQENLRKYNAVLFLNTTGDVLNDEQQMDFEQFIQAGGGYVGIHAATDTEYDWPWYGRLVGAYFDGHPGDPNVRKGTFYVVDKHNEATDSIPDQWEREDEFYSFKQINPEIKVLIKIDEKTYGGGKNGENHPMAWYHDFDGGRSFYTNMGHTNETYADPRFLKHLWGGLLYAMDRERATAPAENRFTKIVLDEKLDEPMELVLLPEDRVLFIERKGKIKIYDPVANKSKVIATIPVSTKYKVKDGNQSEAEDGLLGVAKDPDFDQNHWIYLYYAPAGDEPKNILTRYELHGDELVEASRKVILEVATQRDQCCHTGGSIAFDANGNLFLSTGDNTSPRSTAYSPSDERPGRSPWDAQKSSANTNDLRGKVLRIHPERDGTYSIPDGNLFPKGTPKTRPEIYVMGTRNPFRIAVDKKTGYLYWGDVGPDAGKDSVGKGTKAFDEFNQARKPGYYGWPYFVGDNKSFNKWDFVRMKTGPLHDPAKPINNSPNNTGLNELPPAQKAFIWYPYDTSPEFPQVGTGGRTAMAGPVFHSQDFKNAKHLFPSFYDGKLFIYEWMRGWIMTVSMNKEGDYVSMDRFMPSHRFSNPMDMEFSPTGDLYLLEYGTAWFQGNDDARLVRIEYNSGNRKPHVQLVADKPRGAVPLLVHFSSKGTQDPDLDELKYEWKFLASDGAALKTVLETNPSFTFDKPGIYKAQLTVTDAKGEASTSVTEIRAGNEPPSFSFDITRGNKTFFYIDQPFSYEVKVSDKEDGSLENRGISPDQVSVSIDYLEDGIDKAEIALGHQQAEVTGRFAAGKKLMGESDCKSCHIIDKKSIGPMYKQIAAKYKGDPSAVEKLASKVINGGGGVWGETVMAAHPQLSLTDAKEIVNYILSVSDSAAAGSSLPTRGSYKLRIPKGVSDHGVVVLKAAYTDRGANSIPSITAEKVMVLRSPSVPAGSADVSNGIQKFKLPNPPIELVIGMSHLAYVGFNQIDLTGIEQLVFAVLAPEGQLHAAGGTLEVRIDSPTGSVIGETPTIVPIKGNVTLPVPQMIKVKLISTEGPHDIYLIFKNEKSPAGQALFILLNTQFIYNPASESRRVVSSR